MTGGTTSWRGSSSPPATSTCPGNARGGHVERQCHRPGPQSGAERSWTRGALAVYGRYLTLPWTWGSEPDAVELGWTTQRVAELEEQLGDSAAAAATYTRLLELWRNADPELQPILSDVRQRVGGG